MHCTKYKVWPEQIWIKVKILPQHQSRRPIICMNFQTKICLVKVPPNVNQIYLIENSFWHFCEVRSERGGFQLMQILGLIGIVLWCCGSVCPGCKYLSPTLHFYSDLLWQDLYTMTLGNWRLPSFVLKTTSIKFSLFTKNGKTDKAVTQDPAATD